MYADQTKNLKQRSRT